MAAAFARAEAYHLEARRRRFARKAPSQRLLTQSCASYLLAEELPGYVNQEARVQPGEVGGALDALYAKKGVSERGGPAHVVGRERATQ